MCQIFVRPLLDSNIIQRDRLSTFIEDVFHNFADIHKHHRLLLDRFHAIQRDEHPHIRSITAPVYDAALNWREAYMEYVPHFPIAAYKIDEELANNPAFKSFVEVSQSRTSRSQTTHNHLFTSNHPVIRTLGAWTSSSSSTGLFRVFSVMICSSAIYWNILRGIMRIGRRSPLFSMF
jgi:hypothetical protein